MDNLIKIAGKLIIWAIGGLLAVSFWVYSQNENPKKIEALQLRIAAVETQANDTRQQLARIEATQQQMDSKIDLLLRRAIKE